MEDHYAEYAQLDLESIGDEYARLAEEARREARYWRIRFWLSLALLAAMCLEFGWKLSQVAWKQPAPPLPAEAPDHGG